MVYGREEREERETKGIIILKRKKLKKKLEAEMEEMYDMPMIILKSCIMSIKQMLF